MTFQPCDSLTLLVLSDLDLLQFIKDTPDIVA
jgi:hypothetical protein